MATVAEKISTGAYSMAPYVWTTTRPNIPTDASSEDLRRIADELEAYEREAPARSLAIIHIRDERARLAAEFKRDALEELGLADHPRAEDLWTLAWRNSGHYGTVWEEAQRLAWLLR